ncbi:MAG: hypothetical protein ACYC0U_06485, partial [Ilumatobacteraceae bacterium]
MLDELEPELLAHLEVEFGDSGRRAADFLRSAQALRAADSSHVQRGPAVLAYCLREAMKAILFPQNQGEGGEWKTVSRRVTQAATRYEIARGKPGADEEGALTDLLASVNELEEFHRSPGIHERRLIAIMLSRTGSLPLSEGTKPIREYQELLSRLDRAVHGEVDAATAEDLWRDTTVTLRRFFMPPELRRAELDLLAGLQYPKSGDLDTLLENLVSPQDLHYFLSQIIDPTWLSLLTGVGILAPPSGSSGWAVFPAVERLKSDHIDDVLSFLEKINEMYGGDAQQAWHIGRAAIELGDVGVALVVKIVREHPTAPAIAHLGIRATKTADASSSVIEDLADILLNENAWKVGVPHHFVCERLVLGIEAHNWRRRIELVTFKLQTVRDDDLRFFKYQRAGSISEPPAIQEQSRFKILLGALVSGLERARSFAGTGDLIHSIAGPSSEITERVEAWLLSKAFDVHPPQMIDFIAAAIVSRSPTGDDLRLVDHILELDTGVLKFGSWVESLGSPPGSSEITSALRENAVPENWLRAFEWIRVLPAPTVATWSTATAVLAERFGPPDRRILETIEQSSVSYGHSPIELDTLRAVSVTDACGLISRWRPNGSDWLASARELARVLTTLVKESPEVWTSQPLEIARTLHHPIYISHYLQGLTAAGWPESGDLQQILNVVALVKAEPWVAEVIESDDFRYDADWRGATQSSVEFLKKLADQAIDLGGRHDDIWDFLASATRDRSKPSAPVSGERDPMDTAINRSCTRAFEAALSFIAHE